ncbi:MAG: MarR family transcriptional regulator [Bryobacteraceae bacterium]|nr:MarR family transcriptional regulator [Bryobacteraceae bacterium]
MSAKRLLEADTWIALQRAADRLLGRLAQTLKPYGVSPTQYNALRILRGAGPDGLPCGEVAARMINQDPDVTRLFDRMERPGWILRERGRQDRRVQLARITNEGLRLLESLDEVIAGYHRESMGHLTQAELKELGRLLASIR